MADAPRRRLTALQWIGWLGLAVYAVVAAGLWVWGGDILRAGLDPEVPFQTYTPPPAPDYANRDAWALYENRVPDAGPAAVFFLHSTTYNGGEHWNGPIEDADSRREIRASVLPNYAGPFARAGAVSAPYYRQGSLYTRLSIREDAREARVFAYRDALAAFDAWLARHPTGPIVLAGVEQGGDLILRLLRDRVAPDPALRARLVAAYVLETTVAADAPIPGIPPCRAGQTGCLVAYASAAEHDLWTARRVGRGFVWDEQGALTGAEGRPLLCINPVSGDVGRPASSIRANRGAVNASELEWGMPPALQARQVSAECREGILWHSAPTSDAFRSAQGWVMKRKVHPFNLFYGDLEADVQARTTAWAARSAA